jgi:hypothetical protein
MDARSYVLVEESGGRLQGFEMKWRTAEARPPKSWTQAYPEAEFLTIHPGDPGQASTAVSSSSPSAFGRRTK